MDTQLEKISETEIKETITREPEVKIYTLDSLLEEKARNEQCMQECQDAIDILDEKISQIKKMGVKTQLEVSQLEEEIL